MPPPLGALRTFEAAARHLNFTEAAQELNVSQAAVSQQIRTLEHWLQRQLFDRTSRGLYLTEAGEAYLPIVQDGLGRLSAGTTRIFGERQKDTLAIKVTSSLAISWLARRLVRLRLAFPKTSIQITTFQWNSDGFEDYVDLEVRYGTGQWPGLIVEPLIGERIFPVCSPRLLDGEPPLAQPKDLLQHSLLHVAATQQGWKDWLDAAGIEEGPPPWSLQLDSSLMAYQAAEDGVGVALGRTLLVEERLRSGSLVTPFDLKLPTRETYYMVRKQQAKKRLQIDHLCAWLREEARTYLSQYSADIGTATGDPPSDKPHL